MTCGWTATPKSVTRRGWSERGPVCHYLIGCIDAYDREYHSCFCPLHDRALCPSCQEEGGEG